MKSKQEGDGWKGSDAVNEDSWLVVNWRSETFVVVNPRSMRNNGRET